MDRKYTISEMGKLLGLSNDAIRFYEKKGLVHPSINEVVPMSRTKIKKTLLKK